MMITIPENYRKVTELTEMQDLLRDLMYELHCICEKHNLVYNIYCGTMLGAVRHQDIIPWDDDIDITMPRTDYEKLIQIVKEQYADRFEIQAYPDENYIYPFGKFFKKDTILIEKNLLAKYGTSKLYVDIFPVDGIPDISEKKLRKRFERSERYLKNIYYCTSVITPADGGWKQALTFVKYLRRAWLNIWGYKYFLAKQEKMAAQYKLEDCDRVGFTSRIWGIRGVVDKEAYFDRALYKFGKYEFWGDRDYEYCLSKMYGDYMTPPPENMRIVKHGYDLYIKATEEE